MTRRSRRALPATLTALALLVTSVLVAVTAIQSALGEQPLLSYEALARTLRGTAWSATPVAVAGGVAAIIGLLLFLAAVLPGRARTAALDDRTTLSLRGLRNALRSAAHVDGVESASVQVRSRRVKTVVRTRRTTAEGLAERVRAALDSRLAELALVHAPRVVVRVKAPRSTS